jgi:hypothetical protein
MDQQIDCCTQPLEATRAMHNSIIDGFCTIKFFLFDNDREFVVKH